MSITQQMTPKMQTTVNLKGEERMVIDHKKEKEGEQSSSENGHQNSDLTKSHQQNGSSENHQIIPPKPFPRSSRTGSLSETEDVVVAPPKPKPRTISTCVILPVTSVNPAMPITGGYKVSISLKPIVGSVNCRVVIRQF
jgi:hypothetical protein